MALNDVVKNVYTFANILSQAHHSHVKQWNLHSFHNSLKWAKFCVKVEEETRDKLYRDTLNNHIKSLIILANPVSLMQFDLLNMKNSVQYLCKALCQNRDTPNLILAALKKLGDDYFDQNWLNNAQKSSCTTYKVSNLLGEDLMFGDKSLHLQAIHIVERLLSLLEVCTYSEHRYDRFLEKIFNELQVTENGWELIVNIILSFTDYNRCTDMSERLLRKLMMLLSLSAQDINCGLWKCDQELLCTLCGYDDDIQDLYLNHIWMCADNMTPVYGLDESGNLYRWRHSKYVGTLTYSSLVDCIQRLIRSKSKLEQKLKSEIQHRSQTSYFNVYKDVLNSVCDIETNNVIVERKI